MARPVSGNIAKSRLWVKQKDGTFYCYERERIWKDGKDISTKKLLGKADEKYGELRPTRPKKEARKPDDNAKQPAIVASRQHTGMMDILEFIGKDSGIDEDLMNSTDLPTAQKIISLARYIVGTDGQTFPGIEEWMLTHPVPYKFPITEDVYKELFDDLGNDETIYQEFFKSRLDREDDLVLVVAYDSSTETSVSDNPEARIGMNKDHNGKKAIKIICIYSLRTRRPLIFGKQPGNIPDVISVQNVLDQFSALGIKKVLLVTDGGYSSEDNLGSVLHSQNHTLTRVRLGWSWVKAEVEKHKEDIQSVLNIMPTDTGVKGITVSMTRSFRYRRTYGSKKKGLTAGDYDRFERKIFLHLYYDTRRKEEEDRKFIDDLADIKSLIESGTELNDVAQLKADKYLDITEKKGTITVTYRKDTVENACKYNGMFALLSDYCGTANEALDLYRKREWIEDFFERFQQCADGNTSRTGDPENLEGRLFVQFIAMCYIEELHERIRQMKSVLGKKTGDPEHDTKDNLDKETALKTWLKKRSMFRTLVWFDAHETVEVSSEIRKRRWHTEIIDRDRLFLKKLGMSVNSG